MASGHCGAIVSPVSPSPTCYAIRRTLPTRRGTGGSGLTNIYADQLGQGLPAGMTASGRQLTDTRRFTFSTCPAS